MRLSLKGCLGVILSSFLFSLPAQSPTANLIGRVQDPAGAVVQGAKIVVRHVDSGDVREAKTDDTGEYTVPELPPGEYKIAVEKEGFRRMEDRGVTLEIDQTGRLDFTLQLGSVSETVEIRDTVPMINTENPIKGDVIVSKEMVDIPLNGRDFADLAYLVPGVAQKAQGANGSNFAVNGARSDNTNFVVDGFVNNNPKGGTAQVHPPIDAMMEFKMQTTGYSAEYGRLAGGTMNMVLRSGTNSVHGSLFEFFRNDDLDARNFFALDKTKLRRNQFGGMLDGPVVFPKLYNGRNRTFFLFTWESYRQLNGDIKWAKTPTTLERTGDFSQSLNTNNKSFKIADPLSGGNTGACVSGKVGACFPGNVIPADRIDPMSRKIMAFYPARNAVLGTNNFYNVADDPDAWDSFVGKIDHRIGSADSISGRYMMRPETTTAPYDGSPSGTFGTVTQDSQMLAGISYTRIFTPTLINEARMGLTRTKHKEFGRGEGTNYPAMWGLTGVTQDPVMVGFPRVTVNQEMALGIAANNPVIFTINNYQWTDSLTWVKGRHMFKFGGDIVRTQYFQPYYNNNRGTFDFTAYWTNYGLADFELGYLNQSTRTIGVNPSYLLIHNYGFFAQDDYKITPSLTLNFGVRYELPKPPVEKYGRLTNFMPGLDMLMLAGVQTLPNWQDMVAQGGLAGKVGLASQYGFPPSMVNTPYMDFAPRFGFAWRPLGLNRTVVRGGYGIYYAGNIWNDIRNNLGNVYPFSVNETHNKNTADPLQLTISQNPFGTTTNLNGVLTPNGFQSNPSPQYLQSWNLTTERELGRGVALEVAYVGSKGTHLGQHYNINMPLRQLALQLPGGGFPRPYAGFNDIDYFGFSANSIYNAGILTVRKRITHGLMFHANYVYSKSIDDASQMTGSSDGGFGGVQDARNLRLERARSDWDSGHSFTALFMYDVPFHRFWLLKNWQISGTNRLQTGQPFTVTTNGANLDLGEAKRPDRLYKGTLSNPTPAMWYDTNAFLAVPTGAYHMGNAGRNILDGPGLIDVNVSLIKRIPLRERMNMQFRAEAFNVLNHTNFKLPNETFDAAAGGQITAAKDPRLMQLGLRLQF